MRILYIDIDSLRHDHLQCYGYHRNTAPNIDRITDEGVRFDSVYVSTVTALLSCRPPRHATGGIIGGMLG